MIRLLARETAVFQTNPRGVEADSATVLPAKSCSFRRTLVGLKPGLGDYTDSVSEFQTNPRGVEASGPGTGGPPATVSDEPSWG